MNNKFKHIESRGLPGGPNEQFTYITGVFSIDGYKSDSPDVNNPFNIIPSADITMEGVDFPVRGYGNNGIVQDMKPGGNYNYGDADYVFEVPIAQTGIEVPNIYSDDEIIQLLNTIAYQEGDEDFKGYAQLGGGLRALIKKAGPKVMKYLDNLFDKADDVVKAAPEVTKQKGIYEMLPIKKLEYPTHYGTIDIDDGTIKNVLDAMKAQGKYADDIGYNIDDLVGSDIQYLGNISGRTIVNVPLPNGKSQLFYKSTGLAGKKGSGVGGTSEGLWQPYGGHASVRDFPGRGYVENWFIKDSGYADYYGSESFKNIANKLDEISQQQKWDMSNQILKSNKKQLGGSIAKKYAQKGREQTSRWTISAYEEPAWYEKALDYLASPMTAFGFFTRNQSIPDNLPINIEDRNAFDGVIDTINPFAWIKYGASAKRNFEKGEYFDGVFDALGAIPVVPAWLSKGKNITKVVNKIPAKVNPIKKYGGLLPKAQEGGEGTATERALNMSGGMGNMPLPSEYVLPPALVKQIRETGKIPGASIFIGDAEQVMKNLSDFYKKYGGDISGLDKAQLGAFLKRLKPAIKKGVNYVDEFIKNDLYKYNPWAYNNIDSKLPEWLQLSGENEKWLRQVGKSAIEDAQATRTVRELGEEISPRLFAEKLAQLQNSNSGFYLGKRYPGPFFKKGETFFDYNKKSRPGLEGKLNTRGRSGSADYLIEFNPSDPIKYQGMDSYFQPAYMQNMMLDPAPFNKWIGDVAIMKPKMRGVENFNFYKKDPFWAYKKVPLDELQEGGQAPFDKESWEYYRQQNPEAVMNPSVNDSVVMQPKDSFTKQEFIENFAKPKPEFQKPKTLNFNNILDYVVETRGGNRDLWGKAADTIAFHESGPWARMDVGAKQHLGGPGRGLFQFEGPSLKTAQKRYTNIAKSRGFTPNPDILNAKSADQLNAQDQYTLFFANLIESKAKLSDYAEGKMKLEDLWLKGHKNVEKPGDRESFLESLKAAEKEGIKNGYATFEKGGEFTLYDIYKKYVMGGATDEVSKDIYDKLNRVHYKDAKGVGMSVPNYILTYVMKSS